MDKGDFGDGFFEAWATINPRPAIDHVDIHMYGDSPLQLPWQVYAAPPDDDGPANWEDYFESVGLPRSTPIILGEWSRRIPHYAVDGPGGAYIMCGLSLLADMAEEDGDLDTAIAVLESALEENPREGDFRKRLKALKKKRSSD